jgi:rhodanese-related sulfurtransferase
MATTCGNATVPEYDPLTVQRMLADGSATLIDVREAAERSQERIAGSAFLPRSRFDPAAVRSPNGGVAILYCRTGKRALEAAITLLDAGHSNVGRLRGGLVGWKAAGLPVVSDGRGPMTPMQQTQLLMGSLTLLSTLAGAFWTPWALIVAGFVGCGMIYAGLTANCPMESMLARAPWSGARGDDGGCHKEQTDVA